MILSVLNGEKKRGTFSFISAPYSDKLKNTLLGLAIPKSVEEPIFPLRESSKVSAPRKRFRKVPVMLPEIPKFWMLEWVTSAEAPKLNFFLGVK
ncbi:hypothetical protein D3C86_1708490 [compost metagenome]